MIRLLYIILLLVSLLFLGCVGKGDIDRQLNTAEGLVPEYPDSAMAILETLDTTRMSDYQNNRRDLIFTYACVIHAAPLPVDSTSLIKGDTTFLGTFTSDEIKWLIIKSAYAKQTGNPIARLEHLKDAEFLAVRLDSKFDLAMIYQYLANVYEQGFNGTVSKFYADRSADLLRQLNCTKQLREARMAEAGAWAAKRDYKTMLDSLLAMREEVMANATDGYKGFFLDQLARGYDENGRSEEAIAIWHSVYDNKEISTNTLAHWARAYWHLNKLDSAYMLIQRANSLPHGNTDEYLCRNVEYHILEKMGRKSELPAIDSLRNAASKRIFEDRKLEESSLSLNLKYDSATKDAWIQAAEARTQTLIITIVAIVIVILAVGIWIYMRKRNQALRLAHENDMLKIRGLQNDLAESDTLREDVKARIATLFRSRFNLIDNLAASYFECKETRQEQKRIYSEVRKSISEFSSEAATRELEEIVNGYNDNLMSYFRSDFPTLSKAQYRLALYLFCGFTLSSVSIFTDADIRNIYVYKSRLKSIISKSSSARKETYLSYFA